jgi:tetratricopeptide (TPR) repeat protein
VLLVRAFNPWSGEIPEVAQLARALGTARLIEPRLAGGFDHGPVPSATSGVTDAAIPPRAIIAATEAKQAVAGRTDPDSDGARGIADLLLGDADAAIAALERAAGASKDARRYSDLSAAYLVRARAIGSTSDLQRALSNAERALEHDATLPEAYFNRALALESSGQDAAATDAWRAYLARDPSSAWAQEARGHLERQ